MKTLLITLTFGALMTGCAEFTFEPEDAPPKTELEHVVQKQQNALSEQEQAILNN